MKPSIWLRIAEVLEALGTVGHNLATLSTKPTHGAQEQAVFDAMRGFQFDIVGSTRSTWERNGEATRDEVIAQEIARRIEAAMKTMTLSSHGEHDETLLFPVTQPAEDSLRDQ